MNARRRLTPLLLSLLLAGASCTKTTPQRGTTDDAAQEFVEAGEETFEVRDRITLASVKEEHRKLPEEIDKRRSEDKTICERKQAEGGCVFTDNFPLSEAAEKLTRSCMTYPIYSWVTPAEAEGGTEAVKLWKRRAANREVFDCDGPDCRIIVYATTDDPAVTVLADCKIAKVGDVLGAPERCEAVAVLSKETTLVKVIYAIGTIMCSIGPTRFSFVVVHPPSVSESSIRDALRGALSKQPLGCSVAVGEEKITGTGSYRVSPVLTPYREMMTARVYTHEGGGEPRYFGVRMSVELYVNRYNTTRRKDWRLPDEQQEKRYEEEVKKLVKSSFESVCEASYWRDETILLCDLPPDTPVDEMLRFLLSDY